VSKPRISPGTLFASLKSVFHNRFLLPVWLLFVGFVLAGCGSSENSDRRKIGGTSQNPDTTPDPGLAKKNDPASIALQSEIYVSASAGNDNNPGTLENPVQSLEKAKAIALQALNQLSRPINVYLRGGIYHLAQPLKFTAQDSGKPDMPITFKAYANETPWISGGQKLGPWRASNLGPRIFVTDAKNLKFRQIYVGGETGIRSRYPKVNSTNYFHIVDYRFDAGKYSFQVPSAALFSSALNQSASWENAEIHVYQTFNILKLRIESIIPGAINSTVVAKSPESLALQVAGGPESKDLPFFIENHIQMVQSPMEWFHDAKQGLLYFYAPDNMTLDTLNQTPVVVPLGTSAGENETFIRIEGASYLSFENLRFAHSNWLYPETEGYIGNISGVANISATQRYRQVSSAVQINSGSHLRFKNNVFSQLAGRALGMNGEVNSIEILGNAFKQIGSSGIQIDFDNRVHENILIESNILEQIGGLYSGAGVMAQGKNLKIKNNTITGVSSSGVSLDGAGTNFNLESYTSGVTANEVSANQITYTVQDFVDMGAIYNWARNTVDIKYNTIVGTLTPVWFKGRESYGPVGIYFDAGSFAIRATDNTLYRVQRAFVLNCESNNLIANNRTEINPGSEVALTPKNCFGASPLYGTSTTTISNSNYTSNVTLPSNFHLGIFDSDLVALKALREANFPN
jgi:hypothetical protein